MCVVHYIKSFTNPCTITFCEPAPKYFLALGRWQSSFQNTGPTPLIAFASASFSSPIESPHLHFSFLYLCFTFTYFLFIRGKVPSVHTCSPPHSHLRSFHSLWCSFPFCLPSVSPSHLSLSFFSLSPLSLFFFLHTLSFFLFTFFS